ncbi:fluoride efflux transporter CrcB [Cytobacillus purgationiresistens]|uniref:Fluoride-specific ion channel FluC n=1 Tax=Cytobacillus purgationiresistens TaxID=863449 RepID=A0ABU0AAZ2_9BACI|nr:fluoride efflux transporter CrcB [Cytobacillus purgationiresistens]MDQ0268412.1 CrcB protein [Cytobacillus purgationiresistens]
MVNFVSVAAGGFLGAILRYVLMVFIKKRFQSTIPMGTLFVNLFGSFLLGILLGLHLKENIYGLLGIGFIGAFTTFSTLQVEVIQLWLLHKKKEAILYVILTFIGGVICSTLGYTLVNKFV